MGLDTIDGHDLARSVKAGCIRLEHNRDEVDALNVFPVPDGDTGTNMYLTLLAAAQEGEHNRQEPIGKVAKAISLGSLMGARGNSGVIMSQIFRGMARVMEGKEQVSAQEFAQSIRAGADTAYKAVMKPVEGTILTVIREIARVCDNEAQQGKDILESMLAGIEQGYATLAKTPNMLPILKEAGVVDAGGRGLLFFWDGFIEGLAQEREIALDDYKAKLVAPLERQKTPAAVQLAYQYCTETLIRGSQLDDRDVRDHLGPLGDSMLVVGEGDLLKVHIHSNHPGKVLETCLQFGSLSDIKINNMAEEVHEHKQLWPADNPRPVKALGVVAVGAGEGIKKMLQSLGVDEVVEGGQTMNPSTEDLLNACRRIEAGQIILLPNNGNILMAAEQARMMSERPIAIVPTRSVMQSISALIAYSETGDLEQTAAAMRQAMDGVVYGEITRAVRDTSLNGLEIKAGDYLGLVNGKISVRGEALARVVLETLERMQSQDAELITLFYGQDIEEQDSLTLQDAIKELYPDCEVEMHFGGQPHYPYLLSVE